MYNEQLEIERLLEVVAVELRTVSNREVSQSAIPDG